MSMYADGPMQPPPPPSPGPTKPVRSGWGYLRGFRMGKPERFLAMALDWWPAFAVGYYFNNWWLTVAFSFVNCVIVQGRFGGSYGKLALGGRMMASWWDKDRMQFWLTRPGYFRLTYRYFFHFFDILAIIPIGPFVVLFSQYNRSVADFAGNTITFFDAKARSYWKDVSVGPVGDRYPPIKALHPH